MADRKRKIRMDYNECAEHSGTAEGAQPLKNPELVRKTSKDVNRGLYPRVTAEKKALQRKAGYSTAGDVGSSTNSFSDCKEHTGHFNSTLHASYNNSCTRNFDLDDNPPQVKGKSSFNPRTNSSSYTGHTSSFPNQYQPLTYKSSIDSKMVDSLGHCSPKRKVPDDFSVMTKFKMSSPQFWPQVVLPASTSESHPSAASNYDASMSNLRSDDVLKSVEMNLIDPSLGSDFDEFEGDSLDDDLMIRASQEAEKASSTSSSVVDQNLQAFEEDSFLDNLSSAMLDDMEKDEPNTFGLLGGSCIDEPDETVGYFTRLPDEVLEIIFSYLSINVCCNISSVCKRWSNIISSTKFLPWKKLYQRYKVSEKSGVSTVEDMYKTHSFGTAKTCLLDLIRYMSEFKSIEQSSVDYMRRHQIFQVSCDLLAERTPNLVVQGVPNLWSLLATIVILSRNTRDISQAIKYSLQSQYEHSALIECFYCIATVLLLLQNKHGINCGLHYRLYHALYHYETGSSLAYSSSRLVIQVTSHSITKSSKHVMTQEQVAILAYKLTPTELVKIIAFAGTGKTSTLINYTLRNPEMRFLYVAFNKSVQEYAQKMFPYNVECRTTHSLAYKHVGHKYSKKLSPSWKIFSVVSLLEPKYSSWKKPNMPLYVRAQLVMKTIKKFVASDDDEIKLFHVPVTEKEDGHRGMKRTINPQRRKDILVDARKLWVRMVNPNDKEATVTHDVYLKLYQLKKPKLADFDCILIDEAQDLTPAQQHILLSQDCAKILVGDPQQQIYSFRGATNALQNIPATKIFHLTQSFRFGPEIAYVANSVLQAFKCMKEKSVIGVEELGSVLGEEVGQIAVICRTNVHLFNEVAKLTEQNKNVRIGLVGGVKGYRFDQLLDVYRLYLPESERSKPVNKIQDKFIRNFSNIAQLEKFADSVDELDLLAKIAMVKTHHLKIPEHVERIKSRVLDDISLADVVFSTAHKAKGLEFATVKVTCDFLTILEEGYGQVGFDGVQVNIPAQVRIPEDELNLLYVALTRAKKRLKLTAPILKMLARLNETFAYPVSTKSVISKSEGGVVKCWQCSGEIASTTVLVFERLKIDLEYSIRESRPAGILCSQCAAAEQLGFSSLLS